MSFIGFINVAHLQENSVEYRFQRQRKTLSKGPLVVALLSISTSW